MPIWHKKHSHPEIGGECFRIRPSRLANPIYPVGNSHANQLLLVPLRLRNAQSKREPGLQAVSGINAKRFQLG